MNKEQERTSQVSVAYIPQPEGDNLLACRLPSGRGRLRPDWFHYPYARMLIEDVQNGLMPFARIRTRKPFSVRLQPADERAVRLIASALPSRYYGSGSHMRHDLGESLCDFVRECAGTIMYCSEAFFEIVYILHNDGEATGFRLSHIPGHSITRRRGKLSQELPPDVARDRSLPQLIELPESSIIHIQLPDYVRRTFWQMMDILARASDPGMPEWAMQMNAGPREGPPYDFSQHHCERIKAIAQATKSIGWDGRRLIYENTVEHYRWQRFLRFEEFKIQLRDEILAGINDAIGRAGQRLGFNGTLLLEGVPTLPDVERARVGLMGGGLPFKDVVEPFSWL